MPHLQDYFYKTSNFEIFVRRLPKKNDAGIKSPIIFLHDSLGCVELWRDFPEKLCARLGAEAIIYDRLGYGKSSGFLEKRLKNYHFLEAEALIKMMDHLKISKAMLFGHSDGGTISLIAAAQNPERIEAVVTEGAHVFVDEVTIEGIRQAKKIYQTTKLKEKLEQYHGQKVGDLFDAWTETWLEPQFFDWNIEDLLPKIVCPVLAIQGEKDEFGLVTQVESISKKVAGSSKTYLVPNAGHNPHREQTEAVIQEICEFMIKNDL